MRADVRRRSAFAVTLSCCVLGACGGIWNAGDLAEWVRDEAVEQGCRRDTIELDDWYTEEASGNVWRGTCVPEQDGRNIEFGVNVDSVWTPSSVVDESDALVPGTDFHATGELRCSMAAGEPAAYCPFGVRRDGGGSGTVLVTTPEGRSRTIFFQRGKATGYEASGAGRQEFRAEREGDDTLVRIGEERFRIPDAVIYGG